MKSKIFHIFISFFLATVLWAGSVNANTREYCENLLDSAQREQSALNYTKSLEILSEAKIIANDKNLIDLYAVILNRMGIVYSEILDYEKAVGCFLESYKIAIEESNQKVEIAVLNNISRLYFISGEMVKAKEYVSKAYDIAKQLDDTMMMGRFADNLAKIANELDDFYLAEKYANIAIGLTSQIKDTLTLFSAKLAKADCLYRKKEYGAAEQLLTEMLKQHSGIQYDEMKTECLLLLSRIHQRKGNQQKAIYFANESLGKDPNLSTKIQIYEYLSGLYYDYNSFPLALQYKDSLLAAKDSLAKRNDMSRVMNYQIQFDLINSEKQLAENKAKQKAERILFISIILFVVFLFVIFIWVFRVRSRQSRQRKQITELELEKEKNHKLIMEQQFKEKETLVLLEQERLNNEKLRLEQQLKEQETLALLEQERFKNEMENKNKQLIAKSLFQSNRSKLINELITAFSEAPYQNESSMMESIIQKLKIQLKDLNDVDDFLIQYEQINPSLLLLLKEKYPSLSPEDIHLLSYIYLNMDVKKIAHLLNISVYACQKRKERLSLKLGVKTTDLYQYMLEMMRTSISKDLS